MFRNDRPKFKPFPKKFSGPYVPRGPRPAVIDPFDKEYPRNEAIAYDEMRIIDENGENIGVMSKSEALAMAEEKGMDLVLTAPKANPVVCKIVEWDAFKYKIKKREKEIRKAHKAAKVKEIKVSPKIAGQDLERKVDKIKEIVVKGDQVKITIMKRYPTTQEQVTAFQQNLLTKLADYCTIISIQQKGKNVYVLVKSKSVTNAKA